MVDELIQNNEARVSVTYGGHQGDLISPVPRDALDSDVKTWLAEALQSGSVAGIPAIGDADLTHHVLERLDPTEVVPYARIMCRPKVPFGGVSGDLSS